MLVVWAIFHMMKTPGMQDVSIHMHVCNHLSYDMGFSEKKRSITPSKFLKQE